MFCLPSSAIWKSLFELLEARIPFIYVLWHHVLVACFYDWPNFGPLDLRNCDIIPCVMRMKNLVGTLSCKSSNFRERVRKVINRAKWRYEGNHKKCSEVKWSEVKWSEVEVKGRSWWNVSASVRDITYVFHYCYCLVYSMLIFLLILICIIVVVVVFVVVVIAFALYSLCVVCSSLFV
jgi:hypothetical protein